MESDIAPLFKGTDIFLGAFWTSTFRVVSRVLSLKEYVQGSFFHKGKHGIYTRVRLVLLILGSSLPDWSL